LTGLSQLSAGDFVVHVDHGIAKYQGLRHLSVAGMEGDYLHLSTRAAIASICQSNVLT
jgi:transcription-repair coupling factor (superfamily II helicase)